MPTMTDTITLQLSPQHHVPTEGRVKWLETYGVPPETAQCTITAPLALFERAGLEIEGGGRLDARTRVGVQTYNSGNCISALERRAYARMCAEGKVPSELSADDLLAYCEAREARAEEIRSKRAAQSAQQAESKLAAHESRVVKTLAMDPMQLLSPDTWEARVLLRSPLFSEDMDDPRIVELVAHVNLLAKVAPAVAAYLAANANAGPGEPDDDEDEETDTAHA